MTSHIFRQFWTLISPLDMAFDIVVTKSLIPCLKAVMSTIDDRLPEGQPYQGYRQRKGPAREVRRTWLCAS
jgi:hypothetical protein